jgi:hypothetical protein
LQFSIANCLFTPWKKKQLDPENNPFSVETSLPTPMTGYGEIGDGCDGL